MKPFNHFLLSSVKLGILFALGFFAFALPALAAEFQVQAPTSILSSGEKAVFEVYLNPGAGEVVNAFSINLNLPRGLKSSVVIPADSTQVIWLTSPQVDFDGMLKAEGGFLSPVSKPTRIMTVAAQVNEAFQGGNFSLGQDSKALAADGKGTALPISLTSPKLALSQAGALANFKISSPTHPTESRWYPNKNLNLTWSVTSGTQYSYELKSGLDFTFKPDEVADTPGASFVLPDGVYVFALRQKPANANWQDPTYRLVLVDSIPPADFKIDQQDLGGKKLIYFKTYDILSGVTGYEVLLAGAGAYVPAQSPYLIPEGQTVEKVRALDKAGNEKIVAVGARTDVGDILRAMALIIVLLFMAKLLHGFIVKKFNNVTR